MSTRVDTTAVKAVSKKTYIARRKRLLNWFANPPKKRCTGSLVKGKKVCAVGAAAEVARIPMYNEAPYPKWGDDNYEEKQLAYREWDKLNEQTYAEVIAYYGFTTEEVPAKYQADGLVTWSDVMVELNDAGGKGMTFKAIGKRIEKEGFLNVGA
jgi:hypothetical protein